ncbi:MAG: helix-turn-helix domain-containing protein [Spirosomataceae bacterium]
MNTHSIYIKNMVCDRCILAVKQIAMDLDLPLQSVELGYLVLTTKPTADQMVKLQDRLEAIGFSVLHTPEQQAVALIKKWVLFLVNHPESEEAKWTTSALLSEKIGRDYKYLRTVFKQQEGQTIEQFLLKQRLARAKLLMEDLSLSFTEISEKLGYSSVAHFSAQFKKLTGIAPSVYRSELPPRQVIDQL